VKGANLPNARHAAFKSNLPTGAREIRKARALRLNLLSSVMTTGPHVTALQRSFENESGCIHRSNPIPERAQLNNRPGDCSPGFGTAAVPPVAATATASESSGVKREVWIACQSIRRNVVFNPRFVDLLMESHFEALVTCSNLPLNDVESRTLLTLSRLATLKRQ